MQLVLKRKIRTSKSTIGDLYINGVWECFTLEDVERPAGEKVYGKTAIPRGTYKVVIDYSPHFGRNLPHILDVPGFEGVRIHSGNTDKDTDGCVLVGQTTEKDQIGGSRLAFEALFRQLSGQKDIQLEIV